MSSIAVLCKDHTGLHYVFPEQEKSNDTYLRTLYERELSHPGTHYYIFWLDKYLDAGMTFNEISGMITDGLVYCMQNGMDFEILSYCTSLQSRYSSEYPDRIRRKWTNHIHTKEEY